MITKLRPYWIRMSPNPMAGILIRGGKFRFRHTGRNSMGMTDAETGVVLLPTGFPTSRKS
jgi:hypothetical protein